MNEEQNNGYVEDLRGKFAEYLEMAAEVEEKTRLGQEIPATHSTIRLIQLEGEIENIMGDLTAHVADTFRVTMVGGYQIRPRPKILTPNSGVRR